MVKKEEIYEYRNNISLDGNNFIYSANANTSGYTAISFGLIMAF